MAGDRAAAAHVGPRMQAGLALLELALALAVLMLLSIWGAQGEMARAQDAAARASGAWLSEIRLALHQTMWMHYDALAEGRGPVGTGGAVLFRDARAPTVAELKAAGHLPVGFPERSALGFGARLVIDVGAACPAPGCRLDALAVSDQPVVDAGAPDAMAIAEILVALQGWGATVGRGAPDRLRGPNVDMPNPARAAGPVLPPGTVAAWAGLERNSTLQYLRVGDARNPDFRGDLTVAGAVESGANVVARGGVLAHRFIHPGQVVEPGGGCDQMGAVARGANGGIVSCVSGTWQAPTDGFGGGFARNSKHGCKKYGGEPMHNPRTGGCSCPPGYSAVAISEGGRWYERGGWTQGYLCMR